MKKRTLILTTILCIGVAGIALATQTKSITQSNTQKQEIVSEQNENKPVSSNDYMIPETNEPYIEWNHNKPEFTEQSKKATKSYENYSELDELGRPQVAMAMLGKDLMPTKEREPIGQVKPVGWKTIKYPDLIKDKYLYNRCHLIGFQLAGENANEKNLITGTRFLNVEGMLPFENKVTDYIKETNNHVLYRVTPRYEKDELIARGVIIEAYSIEDNGKGISFAVYCPNIQPGIAIDYKTGESHAIQEKTNQKTEKTTPITVILNSNSGKYHKPECDSIANTKQENKIKLTKTINELHNAGYEPCQNCKPDKK